MQEELELEEGLAVRIDLVYDQGWPQAVPGSPGWSTCPLIAVVSRPAAPESPTFVEDELLWGCTLASVVADGKDNSLSDSSSNFSSSVSPLQVDALLCSR